MSPAAEQAHPPTHVVEGLSVVRMAVGLLHLLVPDFLAQPLVGRSLDRREQMVVRILGVRQLGQVLASGRAPGSAVLSLGVEVDAAHAVSMVGLALFDHRHRRMALISAAMAGGFVLAGAWSMRVTSTVPTPNTELAVARQRWAESVARILVTRFGTRQVRNA